MRIRLLSYLLLCICNCVLSTTRHFTKPLVISSKKFMDHVPPSIHAEVPERIEVCLKAINSIYDSVRYKLPSGESNSDRRQEALDIINLVHDQEYVRLVQNLCSRGARAMSPWDSDTYISKNTFEVCLLAQTAWMDAVDEVLQNKTSAFAVTRPPGHHALRDQSMGAANYAILKGVRKIGIIDFDVHFGNGIAAMVSSSPEIRYTSLHEIGIFPNEGDPGLQGEIKNVFNIGVPYGCKGDEYLKIFEKNALPFIKEFEPELVIVSAGYDALGGDPLANVNLKPEDYGRITRLIKDNFGAVLFGLEGGYDLDKLPLALKSTILEYC